MYGKAFGSMYEGSMVGAGMNVFAVWNYCIAKNWGGTVELNPVYLAFVLGGTEGEVLEAIEKLCSVDAKSRNKVEGGRRLIREGEFQYRMVNWGQYDKLKGEVDRREYNRTKQRERRERLRNGTTRAQVQGRHQAAEREYERQVNNGVSDGKAMSAAEKVHKVYADDPQVE